MNIAVIPCFDRPEFLTLALEHIQQAEGADQLHYIFQLDRGFDRQNINVISAFPFPHEIRQTPRTPYGLAKQSFSVLSGLTYAASKTDGLVYLIEDDVLIGRDFFRWHQAVHDQHEDLFSSHANLNVNRTIEPEGTWDEYYLTTFDYGSIGTCLKAITIRNDIAPHAQPAYFRSPTHYCQNHFKGCPLGKNFSEQDGLIRRIQWASNRPQAYPHTREIDGLLYGPRCYHAGYYGKNRGKGPRIPFQQRLPQLRQIVYSQEHMRSFARHPGYYHDSRPCALELPAWTSLHLKPLSKTSSAA